MEQNFATIFEDVRLERSLIPLLSLTDPDKLNQSNITDHETNRKKYFALAKIYRQRILKE